jgi:hypothetical protein
VRRQGANGETEAFDANSCVFSVDQTKPVALQTAPFVVIIVNIVHLDFLDQIKAVSAG